MDINMSLGSVTKQVEWYANTLTYPCAASQDPQYLAHMNTPNVVRDLDLIRNLSALETLDYIGFDDGSILGVTYAAMFPDRVGKMALSGKCHVSQS